MKTIQAIYEHGEINREQVHFDKRQIGPVPFSPPQNRTHGPTHEVQNVGVANLLHDNRGNLTLDETAKALTYDADNMLASVTVSAGSTTGIQGTHSYTYDALGRRVSKSVGGESPSTTIFVCRISPLKHAPFAGQELAEYSFGAIAADPMRAYHFGRFADEPLAMIDYTNLGVMPAGQSERVYYHFDRRQSVVALSEGNGAIIERYNYSQIGLTEIRDANALQILTVSAIANPWVYTARRCDNESILLYFRARCFSSSLGRFTTKDPLGFQSGPNVFAGWFAPQFLDPTGYEFGMPPWPDDSVLTSPSEPWHPPSVFNDWYLFGGGKTFHINDHPDVFSALESSSLTISAKECLFVLAQNIADQNCPTQKGACGDSINKEFFPDQNSVPPFLAEHRVYGVTGPVTNVYEWYYGAPDSLFALGNTWIKAYVNCDYSFGCPKCCWNYNCRVAFMLSDEFVNPAYLGVEWGTVYYITADLGERRFDGSCCTP